MAARSSAFASFWPTRPIPLRRDGRRAAARYPCLTGAAAPPTGRGRSSDRVGWADFVPLGRRRRRCPSMPCRRMGRRLVPRCAAATDERLKGGGCRLGHQVSSQIGAGWADHDPVVGRRRRPLTPSIRTENCCPRTCSRRQQRCRWVDRVAGQLRPSDRTGWDVPVTLVGGDGVIAVTTKGVHRHRKGGSIECATPTFRTRQLLQFQVGHFRLRHGGIDRTGVGFPSTRSMRTKRSCCVHRQLEPLPAPPCSGFRDPGSRSRPRRRHRRT